MQHNERRKAFFTLKDTLQVATGERSKRDEFDPESGELGWVIFEREQMHEAVNKLRARSGLGPISIDSVERAEVSASGHVDYVEKYALNCADLVVEGTS